MEREIFDPASYESRHNNQLIIIYSTMTYSLPRACKNLSLNLDFTVKTANELTVK